MNFEKLYERCKAADLPKSYQLVYLEHILELGPKTGHFDKKIFTEYLDCLDRKQYALMAGHEEEVKKFKDVKQQQQTQWRDYVFNQNYYSANHIPVGEESWQVYLNHFAEENKGDLSEFKKWFKPFYLKEYERRWQVLCADKGLEDLEDISLEYYESIANETKLEFAASNKECFGADEAVELQVVVKNIKLLQVNVFEFNTETYYMKNKSYFNNQVNLDGLEAAEKK